MRRRGNKAGILDFKEKEVYHVNISSTNSTDWAALLNQYAMKKAGQSSGTAETGNTTSEASQSASGKVSGATAVSVDGDTVELSEAGRSLSATEMFSKMDTDGNGSLSQEEFVAARPEDVTEEMAANLYNSFDTDSSESLTGAEYETAMQNAPPPPPPPAGGAGSSTSSETYDELDTNEDGVVSASELAAALAVADSSTSSGLLDSEDSETFDDLDTNQNGVVSAAEMAAARPEDVTEEMAINLFGSLDTDGSGGLTEEEYSVMGSTQNTNGINS